jgi:ferredoxin-NADP reductase
VFALGDGAPVPERTWTISHASAHALAITVKRHEHGAASRWLHDSAPGSLGVRLLGVSGELVLPGGGGVGAAPPGLRAVAGGVGITPLFAMVAGLVGRCVGRRAGVASVRRGVRRGC